VSASSAVDYLYLRQLVFNQSQNVLESSHDYLFETRLYRLLQREGMSRLEELVHHLQNRRDPSLERAVAEAMTINETSFFRDGRPFELLRIEILPKLVERRRAQRTLRFWSAACSTGQEAYSIAMLLRESFPRLNGWNLRIEGTDIAAEVVERAREGRYHRVEMNRGLPARCLVRFFDHVGEDWFAKTEIKQLCNFRQANICASELPFRRIGDRFDVIFLRNVMLYFSQETRRSMMEGVHSLLAPDGILFLGSTEQPADPSRWISVLAGGTCYFRPREKV
jgi:chemotaxis protein methyltransferase CheR